MTLNPRDPMPSVCPTPGSDPVPFVTERFRRAGAFERAGGKPTTDALMAVRDVVQSMVSAMSDDDLPYDVTYDPSLGMAGTDFKARRVYLGVAPLYDPDLTDGQRAAIMTAVANHEVAHVIHTSRWDPTVVAHFNRTRPDDDQWFGVHNVAEDVRMERLHWDAWPGYADTFATGMWFAGLKGERVVEHPDLSTYKGRCIAANQVRRGPWVMGDWNEPDERAFYDHVRDWQTRYDRVTSPDEVIALMEELLDYLGAPPPDEDGEPEPEGTDEGEPGEGGEAKGRPDKGEAKGDSEASGSASKGDDEGDDTGDGDDTGGRPEGGDTSEYDGTEPEARVLKSGELTKSDEPRPHRTITEAEYARMPKACPVDATTDAIHQSAASTAVAARVRSESKKGTIRTYDIGAGRKQQVVKIDLRRK